MWSGQAVLNPSRDKVAHFTMDEDLVYVQATNGIVTAFDAETGDRQWSVRLGRYDDPSFPIVSNEDLALVVAGTSMYGIDRRTGNILWSIRLPGAPSTGPAVDATQVYVGTLDGSLYAFSLKRIQKAYQERRLPQWSHETMVWRYQAVKEVTSPPITTGRTVNFASRDGSLYAVTANRRELAYQFETDAPIVAPLATSGGLQFLASEDYNFYAIDLANGRIRWEFVAGLPIRTEPFAIGDQLFLHPDRGGLYCIDAQTGVQRWWQPRLHHFVGQASRTVFARDDNKDLVLVNLEDGAMIGRVHTGRFTRHIANDRTDRIFLTTESGRIMALRFRGQDYPVFHKYPERLPLQPDFEPEVPAPPEAMPGDTSQQ